MSKREIFLTLLWVMPLAIILVFGITLTNAKLTGNFDMFKSFQSRESPLQDELLKFWQKENESYQRKNYGDWSREINDGLITNFTIKEMQWEKDKKIVKREFHVLLGYSDGQIYLGDVPASKQRSDLVYIYDTASYQTKIKNLSLISYQETGLQIIFVRERGVLEWVLKYFGSTNTIMIVMLLLVALLLGGFFSFIRWVKSRGRLKLPRPFKSKVTLDDVGGLEEAKVLWEEIANMVRFPFVFAAKGGGMPRGILFSGPPGTGKTLTASAIANALDKMGIPCYSFSCAMFIKDTGAETGVAAARVQDIFRQLRLKSPCWAIFDEIDVLAKARGSAGAELREELSASLSQFLIELGGIEEYDRQAYKENRFAGTVVVLAMTNRPEIIDEALLRSGRIGRHLVFPRPNIDGRREILEVRARGKDFPETEREKWLDWLAKETPGCTGDDLREILDRAANFCATRTIKIIGGGKVLDPKQLFRQFLKNKSSLTREQISFEDLKKSLDLVISSIKKDKDKGFPEIQIKKEIRAYHQAGHKLGERLRRGREAVTAVSIIPDREGYQQTYWLQDLFAMVPGLTDKKFRDLIAVYGCGRAAEFERFGEISPLGADDFSKATEIAIYMASTGMLRDILIGVLDKSEEERKLSDKTLAEREEAIKKIMQERWFDRAAEMIKTNSKPLDVLAKALIEKEDLTAQEVNEIFDKCTLVDSKSNNHNNGPAC